MKVGETRGNFTYYGQITPEKKAELRQKAAAGLLISTEHPDEEKVMALFEQQQEHGVGWGLRQLLIDEGILDQ